MENYTGWQSDIIVDLIKQYGFPFITLNPGASFRGLHDSLVNYGNNDPPMMLCNHEEIAVQIAHGYAKATASPPRSSCITSSACCMPAWRSTTPISTACRSSSWAPPARWTSTSAARISTGPHRAGAGQCRARLHQVGLPADLDPRRAESFSRAYSIMTTEPTGPIYMCYDAALQEAPLTEEVPLPPVDTARTPRPHDAGPGGVAADSRRAA